MTKFDILNRISVLKRKAHEEMVTQNNKNSVERNYHKADIMYDEIKELEKQLKLMKEDLDINPNVHKKKYAWGDEIYFDIIDQDIEVKYKVNDDELTIYSNANLEGKRDYSNPIIIKNASRDFIEKLIELIK